MLNFEHAIAEEDAHNDEDGCQVGRQSWVCGLADALNVYGIPGLFLECEGALWLKLHCVVGAQLDMLSLGQILPSQPQRCPCKRLQVPRNSCGFHGSLNELQRAAHERATAAFMR